VSFSFSAGLSWLVGPHPLILRAKTNKRIMIAIISLLFIILFLLDFVCFYLVFPEKIKTRGMLLSCLISETG